MKLIYGKTLLYSYKNLKRIIRRLDELVMEKALKSMTDCSSCEGQCEKIIELTEQKGIIIKIKHYLDMIFERFNSEEKKLVGYKYLRTVDKKEMSEFDLKSRSYFRKQKNY